MHVVRDLTFDLGQTFESRIRLGAGSLGTALATNRAVGKFFKSGMTASTVATYTGGAMADEEEAALHASISRYAAGVENSFGLMLIPDDVKISNLAIDPEKAQMMESQAWGVREVARLLNLPGYKLGLKNEGGYNSQVQDALDYVLSCLRPIAVTFEQAIMRDLIQRKDIYFPEFKLEGLLRGDFKTQSEYLEKFIRNRIMRPSEARRVLNMNSDPELDELSKADFQPGKASQPKPNEGGSAPAETSDDNKAHAFYAALSGIAQDTAGRCVRRERHNVEKLALAHANDVDGWQNALRDFYGEHAGFVSTSLRLPLQVARAYCAQHGSELEAQGVAIWKGSSGDLWEREAVSELCALAFGATGRAA